MNVLEEANKLVDGDRQDAYGHPIKDFAKIVDLTKPILESDIDPRLKHALYMIQIKVARLLETPDHRDSMIDIAGYIKTYEMCADKIFAPQKSRETT